MPGKPDMLPLHGKSGTATTAKTSSAGAAQWISHAQCFLRTLLKRTTSSRILLGFFSFLALYLISHSFSSEYPGGYSDNHNNLGKRLRNKDSKTEVGGTVMNYNNNNKGAPMGGKFKSKAAAFSSSTAADTMRARKERERMLVEWDLRSNYRPDLAEVGPGRISSFPASLFVNTNNHHANPGSGSAGGVGASKYVPVTAVILSWKRKEGVKAVVAHLRKYPFIQEILIWNNSPDVVLSTHDFADRSSSQWYPNNNGNGTERTGATPPSFPPPSSQSWPSITVFNSVANLHDFSKYTTCTLAKYDHCYIQDDDWINLAMDSMYAVMIDNPQSLITSTLPAMHAQQRSWTFQNPQLGLHTGFSWLGAGSFMPKRAVFKFMMQLGGSNLWKERVQLADLFFALWRNQYPIVLSHALAPLDQSSSWSGRIDQWSVVYEHMTDALFRLTTVLSGTGVVHGSPHRVGAKTDFVADEELPSFKDRHTRGSYFGLWFVLPLLDLGERARSIEVWSTFESTLMVLSKHMVVKASVDGTNWMTCTGETERVTGSIRIKDLRCTDVGRKIGIQLDTRGIQFLRFEMKEPTAAPIEICGIRVGEMLL
ncbi:hypothetical protein BGZ95_007406 [Linnemannia exigua]|uniref:Glycosyl transferase 64 domain-containing protein n=1 Tax=Linnemannia exigua TaxID=604196 RepID=A0AAD4H6W6_9FUNG|nr:hypothetical protein BGZ95_007406 [Linnemannia exigua]